MQLQAPGKECRHGTKNKTISARDRCGGNAFCRTAAAFCRSGLCRRSSRSDPAHSGRRHSGAFSQRAYGRTGKAAEKPVPQGQKAALGQRHPSSQLFHHPARRCSCAGAGAHPADPGACAVVSQPLSADRVQYPSLDRLSQRTGHQHGLVDALAGGHRLGAAAAQDHQQHRHRAGQCGRGGICHREHRGDCIFCPNHLHLYVPRGRKSLPPRPHTGMRLSEAQPRRRAAEILSAVPSVLRKLSDGTMQ